MGNSELGRLDERKARRGDGIDVVDGSLADASTGTRRLTCCRPQRAARAGPLCMSTTQDVRVEVIFKVERSSCFL